MVDMGFSFSIHTIIHKNNKANVIKRFIYYKFRSDKGNVSNKKGEGV